MEDAPRTLGQLKVWLQRRGVDPKKFTVDGEPEFGGYFVRQGPPYWTLNHEDRPVEGTIVRCDNEADLCECFVEVVTGVSSDPQSTTSRIRREVHERIDASWREVIARSKMQWPD